MSYHPYFFGTWVPVVTLVGGAGNVVPVYAIETGTYTRIGRTVFFNIHLHGDGGAEGAGTGQITITLPFATSANQLDITLPWGTATNGADTHVLFCQITPSSTTLTVFKDNIHAADLDYISMTGADQNSTTREIHLQGKIIVQ